MTLCTVVPILHQELAPVMILMTVGAFVVRHLQHPAAGGSATGFVALFALHERMPAEQFEAGDVVVEARPANFPPTCGNMT
jgi:hypothetical protein